jgi:hypothetical protein
MEIFPRAWKMLEKDFRNYAIAQFRIRQPKRFTHSLASAIVLAVFRYSEPPAQFSRAKFPTVVNSQALRFQCSFPVKVRRHRRGSNGGGLEWRI